MPKLVCESAIVSKIPDGAPKYSDVCLSSRWERPRNELDTFDTFHATEAFHATRLNWVYTNNPEFIQKAKNQNLKIQIALTPTLPDLPLGTSTREIGRIQDTLGHLATAPWMKNWKLWWGCVNNPDFQDIYWQNIKSALDAGAHDFQVDDPAFASALVRNEWEDVCHCKYCTAEAQKLGKTPSEIQEESVIVFHQRMKTKASQYAGHPIAFSCNNFRGDWELFPHDFFDYGIAEAPIRRGNPEYIYAALRETRRRGKAQIFSFVSDKTWLIQKVLASTYASGGNLLVPWDVWQGGGKPRYFGKEEDFAHYYDFVRQNEKYFDGYEDAYYTNTQIENRYVDFEEIPLYFSEYRRNFHAFIRAKPQNKQAPVIIHLVDWEIPNVDSTKIILNEEFFFDKGIGEVKLIEPINTTKPKDYKAKISHTKTPKKLIITIPKLENHWGLLVLYPN
ncbi:MAG: hypothetical protein NXI23_17830 [Bacteroidetes bacterium]|jgi:hypothetical protein|nr:hypothetical protein [Bacteroidota bacterium]MDF1864686.1 hypothetical protein [Saprospiraceae bacterium]